MAEMNEISKWQSKFQDVKGQLDKICATKSLKKENTAKENDCSETLENIKKACDDANRGVKGYKRKMECLFRRPYCKSVGVSARSANWT